jgi:hypothetical protein
MSKILNLSTIEVVRSAENVDINRIWYPSAVLLINIGTSCVLNLVLGRSSGAVMVRSYVQIFIDGVFGGQYHIYLISSKIIFVAPQIPEKGYDGKSIFF